MFDSLQPIILTPLAAAEARKIMQTKNIPDGYGLRVVYAAVMVVAAFHSSLVLINKNLPL